LPDLFAAGPEYRRSPENGAARSGRGPLCRLFPGRLFCSRQPTVRGVVAAGTGASTPSGGAGAAHARRPPQPAPQCRRQPALYGPAAATGTLARGVAPADDAPVGLGWASDGGAGAVRAVPGDVARGAGAGPDAG